MYHNEEYKRCLSLLKSKPKTEAFEEIMEKLALLSYFIGREAHAFMELGNPIFKELYDGYFSNIGIDTVKNVFKKKVEPYSDALNMMLIEEMKLKRHLPGKGRLFLLSFKEAVNKVTSKEVKGYTLDLLRKEIKMDGIIRALTQQVFKNVERREKEGIPQKMTKLYLKQYLEGNITEDNKEVVERLVAEANTQLGLLRLPVHFDKYKNTIIETVNDTAKLITGDRSDDALLKISISKENLKEGGLLAQQCEIEGQGSLVNKILERDKDIIIDGIEKSVTPEELKEIGFTEVSPSDLTIDKSGKLVYQGDDSAAVEKKRQQQEEAIRESHRISMGGTPREVKQEHDKYIKLGEEALVKSKLIVEALETGKPMDDDLIYRKMLRKNKHYQKIREVATGKPLDPTLLKRIKTTQSKDPILVQNTEQSISTKRKTKQRTNQ